MKSWGTWENRIKLALKAVENLGGEATGYNFAPPVHTVDIEKVENQLDVKLPRSFVDVLINFSSKVDISWSLPDDEELDNPLPNELRGIFGSHVFWSLKDLPEIEQGRKGWEDEVFPNPNDEYDVIWHNKLGFMEVGNGDYIAFDLNDSEDYPVIYLSHDGSDSHGCRLGDNFIDFIEKLSLIGFVGLEDWQLTPFMNNKSDGIDPNCSNAKIWREWLNLKLL